MNKEQERQFARNLRLHGVKASEARAYAKIVRRGWSTPSPPKKFEEGDKVKLDLEKIKARQNYEDMSPKYKKFVDENPDTVFTAHIERENMISLSESPQWLFWSGDLLKAEDE